MEVELKELRIATFNIGTLTGKDYVMGEMERRKIDICALLETKQKGSGWREVGEYVIYYKGHESRGVNGVALAVSRNMNNYVKKVYFVSDRIMFITAIFDITPVHFFSIYAPQQGQTEKVKSHFWRQLYDVMVRIPENDIMYPMGDYNGQVGQDNSMFELFQGRFGIRTRNEDGLRILEFARYFRFVLCNTMFNKDRLATYIVNSTETQIDFILTRLNHVDSVLDCKVEDPLFDRSHHQLVVAQIELHCAKPPEGVRTRSKFPDFIGEDLHDSEWIKFLDGIGIRERRKLDQTERDIITEVRNILQPDPMDFLISPQEVRRFSNITACIPRTFENFDDEESEMLLHPSAIQDYSTVYNILEPEEFEQVQNVIEANITSDEVMLAIKHNDTIERKKFFTERQTVQEKDMKDPIELAKLYNDWLSNRRIPEPFTRKVLMLSKNCKDLIEISRYEIEIFDCILYLNFQNFVSSRIERYEFLYNEALLDVQENILRRLGVKVHTKQLRLVLLVLEKAYKSVSRSLLIESLKLNGWDEWEPYKNTILLTYANPTVAFKTSDGERKILKCPFMLRDSSPLSRLLLALAISFCMRQLNIDVRRQLGYEDQVILVAKPGKQMQQLIDQWTRALSSKGLHVDRTVEWSSNEQPVDDGITRTAKLFYIGQVFNLTGNTESDWIRNINSAWDKWRSLSFILQNEKVPLIARCRIYEKVIRAIALHGTQKASVKLELKNALERMEERMLRDISPEHYLLHTPAILETMNTKSILDVLEAHRVLINTKIELFFERLFLPNLKKPILQKTFSTKFETSSWFPSLMKFASKNNIDITAYLVQHGQMQI